MNFLSPRLMLNLGHLRIALMALSLFGNEAFAQVETFFKVDPAGTYLAPLPGDVVTAPSSLDLAANQISVGDVIEVKVVGFFNTAPDWHEFGGDRWNHMIGAFFAGAIPVLPGFNSAVSFATSAKQCGIPYFSSEIAEDFYVQTSWQRVVVPPNATSIKFATNDCYFRDNFDANNDFGVLWRKVKLDQVQLLNPLAKALSRIDYTVDVSTATDAPTATAFSADGRSAVLLVVKSMNQLAVTFSASAGSITAYKRDFLLNERVGSTVPMTVSTPTVPCDSTGCVYLALLWPPAAMPANAGFPPSVQVEVSATQGGVSLPPATIKLQPPPVLFVHGIWSSANAAKFATQSGGMRDWMWARYGHNFLRAVEYEVSSHKRFDDQTIQSLFELGMHDLFQEAASAGTVARTVDVAAHSMGGLITRYFLSNFPSNSIVPLRPVRTLVTIGTPHQGSALAKRLLEKKDQALLSFSGKGVVWNSICLARLITPCTLGGVLGSMKRSIDTGVGSLSPNSDSLQLLSSANAFDPIIGLVPTSSPTQTILDAMIGSFIPGESVASILSTTAHDTIVSQVSQTGGKSNGFVVNDIVHTNLLPVVGNDVGESGSIRVWTQTFRRLTNSFPAGGVAIAEQASLKTQGNAPLSLPNFDLTGYAQVPATNVTFSPATNATLVIGVPTNIGATSSTKTITQVLLMQKSVDVADVPVMTALQSPFSIPYLPTRLGTADFTAIISFSDLTYAVTSLRYVLQPSGSPTALSLTGAPIGSIRVGMAAFVKAIAEYPTGSIDVTGAATYAIRSGSSGVINVVAGGSVVAAGAGSAWLDVSYQGHTSSAQILVHSPPQISIDVDGNGSYRPLTDGMIILRYLQGNTTASLIAGLAGSTTTPLDASAVLAKLDKMAPQLDIDGDGKLDPLTDGVLILRYLFGLRGAPLIAGVVALGATRETPEKIEAYIRSLMP